MASTKSPRLHEEEAPRDTQWEDLPAEMQGEVLRRHVQWSARTTCAAWQRHIEAGTTHLRLRWPAPATVDSAQLAARLPRLRSLDGCHCPAQCIAHLAPPLLASLTLNYSGHRRQGMTRLLPLAAAATLTSLDLRGCCEIADIAALAACTALRTLCLSSSTTCILEDGGNVADAAVLGSCPSLTSLHMDDCGRLRNVAFLSSCTVLTTIDLRGCWSLTSVAALPHCAASLTHLNLAQAANVTDFSPLSACTALLTLGLCCCGALADLGPLSACTALSSLDLSLCHSVSDLTPLAACASLTRVDISNCSRVGHLGPLAACAGLQTLVARACHGVHDIAPLLTLASLQHLDLHWCRELGALSALTACAALTYLDVRDCPRIGGDDVVALTSGVGGGAGLVVRYGSTLEDMTRGGCGRAGCAAGQSVFCGYPCASAAMKVEQA